MKEPKSMDECVYFTNRKDAEGTVRTWVFRELCPKCKKGMMGKPKDLKTGRFKIRASEYECPECKYTVGEQEYEDTLKACIRYECKCGNKADLEVPYKRKRVMRLDEETQKKKAVEAIMFECDKCKHKFLITKKMK